MRELNVLYLSDNNYAVFAGVSILSLFINNHTIDKFHVYVIDDSISNENKEKLLEVGKNYGHDIIFLDMTEGINTLKAKKIPQYRNSYTTYLKLFAFGLLPDEVKRIFFIDSDTIVVGDLGEMIDFDMHGCTIGAVRDGLCHKYKVALGFPPDDSWFNMGIMLVDVDLWKKTGAERKIFEQLEKRKAYIAVDQDLLNITQHGNIATLHPRYNATPHHFVYSEKAFRKAFKQGGFYEDLKVMEEAQKHPVIRHFERFVGQSAWQKNTVHPYAPLFDKYLDVSPWKDYVKKAGNPTLTAKIELLLYKILPHDLFVYVFAAGFNHYLLSTNKKMVGSESLDNIT